MGNSSDDEDFDTKWIFYKDKEEWNDVQPIPQEEVSYPVVKIAYSPKFEDVFDYFRAIIKSNEKSERALSLVTDAITLNPSNYTVWNYRRVLLSYLKKDLYKELGYLDEIIEGYPKNYQVWHHRQVIVEWLKDGSMEKSSTSKALEIDAKNYHAWQHRQWAIKQFGLWEGELNFVNQLLDADIRNNSAWNQRYFVIKNTTDFTDEIIAEEMKFVTEAIKKAPYNESPWNYLRGMLEVRGLSYFPQVVKFTKELYEEGINSNNLRSPHLLAFLVDILEEQIKATENKGPLLQKALGILEDLAKKQDSIRKKYWNYLAQNLIVKYS